MDAIKIEMYEGELLVRAYRAGAEVVTHHTKMVPGETIQIDEGLDIKACVECKHLGLRNESAYCECPIDGPPPYQRPQYITPMDRELLNRNGCAFWMKKPVDIKVKT